MDVAAVTRIIALAGVLIGLMGILFRMREIFSRPFKSDLSRPQGSVGKGVLYAFTLGMAPWEKESTRKHWVSYFRGIFFHLGIFTAFGVLLISPWLNRMPPLVIWLGLVMTAVGAIARFCRNLHAPGRRERACAEPAG